MMLIVSTGRGKLKCHRFENPTDSQSVYRSGKCSDFTVVAGDRSFPVHRVL
jgi:hypothetical protein